MATECKDVFSGYQLYENRVVINRFRDSLYLMMEAESVFETWFTALL
jgi:hypothetical protein